MVKHYATFEELKASLISKTKPSRALERLRQEVATMPPEQLLQGQIMLDVYEATLKLISACHVFECSLDELIQKMAFDED